MATLKRPVLSGLPAESNRLKRTLYIGGLDENVDKTILQAAFIPFGDLRTVEIPKDRATGRSCCFISSLRSVQANIEDLALLNSRKKKMRLMQLTI